MSLRNLALCLVLFCQVSCSSSEPPPPDRLAESAALELTKPMRTGVTPVPIPADAPEVRTARNVLRRVVQDHARDPNNPWAIVHALLAMGPELTLSNQANAVEYLFKEYGQLESKSGTPMIKFPVKRGDIRIEPHRDLILKALTEIGVSPEQPVMVAGQSMTVADLYRHSLQNTWVEGENTSFGEWDDGPWTLQALATWAPESLTWNTDGHAMSLDSFTSAMVNQLRRETEFLHIAKEQGGIVKKRKQGIFRYTCGGAHFLQGTAYAVARGFGTDADRASITEEIDVMFYRFRLELDELDEFIKLRPDYRHLLLAQRLKFLGHFLETTHKLAAMKLFTPNAKQREVMQECAGQLIATVAVLENTKILTHLNGVRKLDEQLFLDFVGDSAHALRGLDLATGMATVHY